MKPDFDITLDRVEGIARLTLAGFFGPSDVAALGAAIIAEYPKLGSASNAHRTLLDLRAMDIQSQETLAVFADLLNDPSYQAERLAVVFSHTLVRMQITRVAARRGGAQFFDTVEAAEAWLAERGALAA